MSPAAVELAPLLAVAVAILALVCLALVVALLRARRRHRACRHTLARVRQERDAAFWERVRPRA